MLETLTLFVPFIRTVFGIGLILWLAHWLLIKRQSDLGNERLFPRQLIMLGLTIIGILVAVFSLPVGESSRNQLVALMGILLSGVFAFSSTTITSNLMAGMLLRITKPFKVGDFIRIGDHFGRVSERGLFDTEIQSESREFIALPNNYCINNPVTTIRSSGTIISADLSLGYDIDHRKVEPLLVEAAHNCGLTEPFVHIIELANFAVSYRVSGFLDEPKLLISVRSNLYACVLDILHSHGIEIMSPTIMNQRKMNDEAKIIPLTTAVSTPSQVTAGESIAFDKAEQAEQLENEKLRLTNEIERLKELVKQASGTEQKKQNQQTLETMQTHLKSIEEASLNTEDKTT